MSVFIDCRPKVSHGFINSPYVIYCSSNIERFADPVEAMSRPVLFLSSPEITIVVSGGITIIYHLKSKYPSKRFIEIEDHAAPMVIYSPIINRAISPITMQLYLSGSEYIANKYIHNQCGIRYILNAAEELPNVFESDQEYKYKKLYIRDLIETNLQDHFMSSIKFIQEGIDSGHAVLVHCAAGISRSSSIVIAYIMWKQNCTFEEAYRFVLSKRNIIEPNIGFYRQLKIFEQTLSKPMDVDL